MGSISNYDCVMKIAMLAVAPRALSRSTVVILAVTAFFVVLI